MRTVERELIKLMVENGLSESAALEVIESIKANVEVVALAEVLHEGWDEYPVGFKAVAWMTTKRFVVEWIDKNCPAHFARSLFL